MLNPIQIAKFAVQTEKLAVDVLREAEEARSLISENGILAELNSAGAAVGRVAKDYWPESITSAFGSQSESSVFARAKTLLIPVLERDGTASPVDSFVSSDGPLARLYNRLSKSVAKVECIKKFAGPMMDDSHGTAFSISHDGKLLTADHVVNEAKDFWLVDRSGAVHEAYVLKPNDEANDLTVLQLKSPSSHKAFTPLPMYKKPVSSLRPDGVYGFGHPGGFNRLVMSPGVDDMIPVEHAQTNHLLIPMNMRRGNSGGPIVSRSSEWAGIATQTIATKFGRYTLAADKSMAAKLLEQATDVESQAPVPVQLQLVRDQAEARTATERYWGRSFNSPWGDHDYHAKFINIEAPNATVLIRSSLDANSRRLSIRPVALNAEVIPSHIGWGTSRMKDAQISVMMDNRFNPVAVRTHGDPDGAFRSLVRESTALNYIL